MLSNTNMDLKPPEQNWTWC